MEHLMSQAVLECLHDQNTPCISSPNDVWDSHTFDFYTTLPHIFRTIILNTKSMQMFFYFYFVGNELIYTLWRIHTTNPMKNVSFEIYACI